jgi:hypothetical protein
MRAGFEVFSCVLLVLWFKLSTQCLAFARQALYHLSHACSLVFEHLRVPVPWHWEQFCGGCASLLANADWTGAGNSASDKAVIHSSCKVRALTLHGNFSTRGKIPSKEESWNPQFVSIRRILGDHLLTSHWTDETEHKWLVQAITHQETEVQQ